MNSHIRYVSFHIKSHIRYVSFHIKSFPGIDAVIQVRRCGGRDCLVTSGALTEICLTKKRTQLKIVITISAHVSAQYNSKFFKD